MGAELVIPISISLIALLIADSESLLLGSLSRKSMNLEDRTQVRVRLAQLGRSHQEDYENFRLVQFALIATHTAFLTLAFVFHFISLVHYIIICIGGAALVIYGLERNLNNRCKSKLQRIESEFPSLIEMLTLAAGAGESPISSLRELPFEQMVTSLLRYVKLSIAWKEGPLSLSLSMK